MATVNRRTLLIFAGVVFTAVALNLIVPLMIKFASSGVPVMWSVINSWLKPPYLYVVINGIILTIAASSMLCYKLEDESPSQTSPELFHEANRTVITPEFLYESRISEIKQPFLNESTTTEISAAYGYEVKTILPDFGYEVKVPEAILPEFANPETQMTVYQDTVSEVKSIVNDEDEEYVISRSNWSPKKRNISSDSSQLSSIPTEKPLVSSRFSHRKPIRASPEGGKALKVSKPKRQETFESTWKTITDGRHVPLTRHLRKSDTFENHDRQINPVPLDRNVIKSETFKDRTNYQDQPKTVTSSPGLVKLRKEPSLGQDDLNRRVEAFITKFNEDMRLQRQQSLNQFKEMINRGA